MVRAAHPPHVRPACGPASCAARMRRAVAAVDQICAAARAAARADEVRSRPNCRRMRPPHDSKTKGGTKGKFVGKSLEPLEVQVLNRFSHFGVVLAWDVKCVC